MVQLCIENVWRVTARYMGHITLYMFTHILQVNVFLACSDVTHANFTLLHMSGLGIG